MAAAAPRAANPFHRLELSEEQRVARARQGAALNNRHAAALEDGSAPVETSSGRASVAVVDPGQATVESRADRCGGREPAANQI